jgi:excisionase family DNA binding protein
LARTRLNPRLAKLNRTYAVDEVARLYGVHRATVRRWLKGRDLAAIDDRRPTLIHGAALREFLTARRAAAKRPTPSGMMHCFGCHQARAPALGMADFERPKAGGAGNLRALCDVCGTVMNRRARWEAVPSILPESEVRVVEREGHIAERTAPSLNVDLKKVG